MVVRAKIQAEPGRIRWFLNNNAAVAQRIRASVYGTEGRGFESLQPHHCDVARHVKVRDVCLTLAPGHVSHFSARLRFICPGDFGTCVSLLAHGVTSMRSTPMAAYSSMDLRN